VCVLVSECDNFEDCDVTSITSQSRDIIDHITNRRAVALSYRLPPC